jgi:hypothetical protein
VGVIGEGRVVPRERADPGVRVRRRISFRSTNLVGSIQDDDTEKETQAETCTTYRLFCGRGAFDCGD